MSSSLHHRPIRAARPPRRARSRAFAPRLASAVLQLALASLLAVLLTDALRAQQPVAGRTTFIRDTRVFDGERVHERTSVLVQDGAVKAIGTRLTPPAGATIVDGTGRTLLPGLIDAHTHAIAADALREAISFGVTTSLDQFTDHTSAAALRAEQKAGRANAQADLFSAGTLVTAPGGHGTQFGLAIPTLARPADAQAFVDARLAEGSDWIKIVYDDGRTYALTIPTLDRVTMAAAIHAARARDRIAVVHIGSQRGAREAIEDGASGLVHLFVDEAPAEDFAALVRQRGAFVIPTLSVNESVAGTASGTGLVGDSLVAPFLTPQMVQSLRAAFPRRPGTTMNFAHALETVRRLSAAGVPILAGSDAPNPGTAHGASMHRELELLVQAGLTPVQALRAATFAPARAFRLADRGRIAPGLRADLVLVQGDPTREIGRTRDIVAIWKGGVPVDRGAQRAAVAAARAAARAGAPVPAGSEGGLVSSFDDGSQKTAFGAGWMLSTDRMAGGKSEATLAVEQGALVVRGTVGEGLAYAWSGVMFSPGAAPFQPANLSAKQAIAFRVRGDGRRYRVMLFAQSRGQAPLTQSFTAGPEWAEVSFSLSAFSGFDGRDLMGVVFAAGPDAGPFRLELDDVRFR
jgi:imidazolonepropionase-like amidohydrolase